MKIGIIVEYFTLSIEFSLSRYNFWSALRHAFYILFCVFKFDLIFILLLWFPFLCKLCLVLNF